MYTELIDREQLEDRLEVLEHLIATHEERLAEYEELSLVRTLLHAHDEGLIEINHDGECLPVAAPALL